MQSLGAAVIKLQVTNRDFAGAVAFKVDGVPVLFFGTENLAEIMGVSVDITYSELLTG
jgi:hypothetical protein